MSEENVTFWTCVEDTERLTHTERDEAVREYLDDMRGVCDFPETVQVFGFKRIELEHKEPDPEWILEEILERLDEEHGDPEGHATPPSVRMLEACQHLVDVIRQEYEVWTCEQVTSETVNVREWIQENEPEWCGRELLH